MGGAALVWWAYRNPSKPKLAVRNSDVFGMALAIRGRGLNEKRQLGFPNCPWSSVA
jgi:hypothetical protein